MTGTQKCTSVRICVHTLADRSFKFSSAIGAHQDKQKEKDAAFAVKAFRRDSSYHISLPPEKVQQLADSSETELDFPQLPAAALEENDARGSDGDFRDHDGDEDAA